MTVPTWTVVLAIAIALAALADWILLPFARWIVARRRRNSIAVLNRQLRLRISPFKLAGRRAVVQQLMLDPAIQAAIEAEAAATGEANEAVAKRASRYAREIVPAFNATMYFRIGTRLARWLAAILYRVRIGASDEKALEGIDPAATVVFVINHRSNMDYVLVTYLASRSSTLSYAVGEWAQVPGLRGMIRLMGAYFIRRDSGNTLYRRVLGRYVHLATAAGVTQAVFPESGLSRDGALQPPRLGLLSYMLAEFDPRAGRDIVFVPVGINYDRVLEDRVLTAAAAAPKGTRPRFAFQPLTFLRFAGRTLVGRLFGRWYRNGYACVSFGRPISVRHHLEKQGVDLRALPPGNRNAEIERLGARVMSEVGRAVPALPVSLVALALLEHGRSGLTRLELLGKVFAIIETLEQAGVEVYIPRVDRDYAVDVGLRMLVLRRLVTQNEGLCRIVPAEAGLAGYYANAIAHHVGRPPFPVTPQLRS